MNTANSTPLATTTPTITLPGSCTSRMMTPIVANSTNMNISVAHQPCQVTGVSPMPFGLGTNHGSGSVLMIHWTPILPATAGPQQALFEFFEVNFQQRTS